MDRPRRRHLELHEQRRDAIRRHNDRRCVPARVLRRFELCLAVLFPATVDLSIDGGARAHFSNPATPPDKLDWKLFTVNFTATQSTTAITFLNGDASNNYETPLDNVQLTDISPAAVPEPSSLTLFGTAFVAVAGYVGRRRSKPGSGSHA